MRGLFPRLRRRHRPVDGPPNRRAVGIYRPLSPWQVRQQRFGLTPFGRRGLDPQEVGEFLDRVARELTAVHDALTRSRQETNRIKAALGRWQSAQAQARTNQRGWSR